MPGSTIKKLCVAGFLLVGLLVLAVIFWSQASKRVVDVGGQPVRPAPDFDEAAARLELRALDIDQREAAALEREFVGLLRHGSKIYFAKSDERFDVRPLLVALREAKASGDDFDEIARIEFVSESKAEVLFTWSSGFHSGQFIYNKESAGWRKESQKYYF